MKVECPHCGFQIEYDGDDFYSTQCPRCRALDHLHNPMREVKE